MNGLVRCDCFKTEGGTVPGMEMCLGVGRDGETGTMERGSRRAGSDTKSLLVTGDSGPLQRKVSRPLSRCPAIPAKLGQCLALFNP